MFDKQAELERLYGISNESVINEILELLDRLNLDELRRVQSNINSRISNYQEDDDSDE